MINFFIADTNPLHQGTAETAEKGAEILKLLFPNKKAFVVENQVVKFTQNMLMDEAETFNPLKIVVVPVKPKNPLKIVVVPVKPKNPLKIVVVPVKPKKIVEKRPLKLFKPKKTTVKSKVNAKTKKVKKTTIKSKVKPLKKLVQKVLKKNSKGKKKVKAKK
jgi:hypothetical protein